MKIILREKTFLLLTSSFLFILFAMLFTGCNDEMAERAPEVEQPNIVIIYPMMWAMGISDFTNSSNPWPRDSTYTIHSSTF